MVLGHEGLGIVEDIGRAVHRVQRGDRVVLPAHIYCGVGFNCARGDSAACLRVQPGHVAGAYTIPAVGPFRGSQAEPPSPGAGPDKGDKRGVFRTSACGRGPRVDRKYSPRRLFACFLIRVLGLQVQCKCTGRTRGQEPAIIRAAAPRPALRLIGAQWLKTTFTMRSTRRSKRSYRSGAWSSAAWWVTIWLGRARPLTIRSRRCVVYRRSWVRPNPTVTPLLNNVAQGTCKDPSAWPPCGAGAASVEVNKPAMPSRPSD